MSSYLNVVLSYLFDLLLVLNRDYSLTILVLVVYLQPLSELMSGFGKILSNFIESSSDFKLIYRSGRNIIPENEIKRILILDSSFNPPHLGHLSLINQALIQTYNQNDVNNREIMLLLLIENVDKKKLIGELFDKRLEMMYLMAQEIEKTFLNINDVTIGLTKHGRFIDKSLSIINFLKNQNLYNDQILTFLVGFDTLIRIFNPKYYLPDKLSNSLDNFMKTTNLFCLTRNFDQSIDENYQNSFLNTIKTGNHDDIPSHWGENIYLVNNNDEHIRNISSSTTRNEIESSDPNWKLKVLPQIRDLIIKNGLYGYKE